MPDCYDPQMEALIGEMLRVLAPDVDREGLGYIEQLRALQTALVDLLSGKTVVAGAERKPIEEGLQISPEDEALLRFALGKLDAKAGDHELEGADVVRRELSAIDKELMRWTSGLVQPPGPSGDACVAPVEESTLPEALRPV
jgi:hypothetical protein